MNSRFLGFGLLAVGLVIVWFEGLAPLRAAQAAPNQITYEFRLLMLGPLLVYFGAAFLAGGTATWSVLVNPRATTKSHLTFIALLIGAFIACVGFDSWINSQLATLGYGVK